MLWMRPSSTGDGWGLSAQKVPISEILDEDLASREEFLAISLKDPEIKGCSDVNVKFGDVGVAKDDEGDVSADEGSTAGGSSSDGWRESSDEDPLSPSTTSLTLLSPAVCSSNASSPMKSAAARISLEAALYNSISPVSWDSVTAGESGKDVPPAPWWWPTPQFDAPELEDSSPNKEVEDVPNHDAPPGLVASSDFDIKGSSCNNDDLASNPIRAPPGLEQISEVPNSDFPQDIKFDVDLSSADSDTVPPPPTWSAENATLEYASSPLPPAWWPTSSASAALDTTPPPPSWWADETSSKGEDTMPPPPSWSADETQEKEGMHDTMPPPPSWSADETISDEKEGEVSTPPSSSCPAPPVDGPVSGSTPPPPSYDAPGFESSSASPMTSACLDSLPKNVAAPPTEPPKLVLSLENLGVAKAPPTEDPKDLPKLKVSLDDLTTSNNVAKAPFMAPPAYTAPGFMPQQYLNGFMPPTFSPSLSSVAGSYPSPMSIPQSWGRF